MAFWKKGGAHKDEPGTVTGIIGQEMQLDGNISFKGKLRLDGRVQGNIRGDYLIMGEKGLVVGDVLVNTFICAGRVEGNVSVKKFQISASGVINGKVEASDLEVESGACLSGEIKSRNKELPSGQGSSAIVEDEQEPANKAEPAAAA